MTRPATRSLIEEAHRYDAFYRDGFANHLPMALVALDAMGATDSAIARFTRGYVPHLEAVRSAAVSIAPGEESSHLGKSSSYPAWIAYFEAALARGSAASVLQTWSATFAKGVGSAAFHGAIRTAYALESGVSAELARAMAYWAAAHEALPAVAPPSGSMSPLEVLREISRHPEARPEGRGITARIRAAVAAPSFAAHVASLDPKALDGRLLAEALIRAYAASGDFTLLHGVTGAHAFRILAPHFEDRLEATRQLWTAIVAAYMSCGSPSPDGWKLQGSDALSWPEIHRKAAACDDEHDVKFAYSCWREWQECGDDLYRRAASARVCHALAQVARTSSAAR